MCIAIPGKIFSKKGDCAVVDFNGIQKEVNISLVNNLKKGDFVIVHAGFAIERLNKNSAKNVNFLLKIKK